MTRRKSQSKFNVGDRVMHKSTDISGFKSPLPPRTKLGVIQQIEYKSNARGALMPWLKIKWDSSYHSEWHMTMRVVLAPDQETVDAVVQNKQEKIN
tara:strand:- start:285 stop:572 length:288 start_codon:yes stop_codon:yes gene_type:complete